MIGPQLTRRVLFLAGAGLAAGGCATPRLAPVTSAEFAPAEDEKRMWAQVEEAEKEIETSGLLYEDPALDGYLAGVAARLQPPEVYKAIPFEISVIANPKMNAFALPTGHVYVHTGILARLDNEAQLATLLAHEMTHATHRHAIKGQRDLKSKAAASAVVGAAFGGVPIVGPMATMFTVLGTTAAITGYSRDLEREADVVGLGLMVKAGYDPAEAPKIFEALKREVEEEKVREPFLYATHPRLQERIETYQALLGGEYRDRKGGATGEAAFLDKTARAVLDTARSELRAGRFAAAERGAAKYVKVRPRDGRGPYTLGEVYRQRAGDGDGGKAIELYRKAIALDPGYADPHKGLGLVYFKRGDKKPAKAALERYLALAPGAPDRAYVQETIKLCAQ